MQMIEFWIITILLSAFGCLSIWVMLLLERIHQMEGYIERLRKRYDVTGLDREGNICSHTQTHREET